MREVAEAVRFIIEGSTDQRSGTWDPGETAQDLAVARARAAAFVRYEGYKIARVRDEHGYLETFLPPPYRPTGRVIAIDQDAGWTIYSESIPFWRVIGDPDWTIWELHTPSPVTAAQMDAILLRLKAEIQSWGAHYAPTLNDTLPGWAEGWLVKGDIEEPPRDPMESPPKACRESRPPKTRDAHGRKGEGVRRGRVKGTGSR